MHLRPDGAFELNTAVSYRNSTHNSPHKVGQGNKLTFYFRTTLRALEKFGSFGRKAEVEGKCKV